MTCMRFNSVDKQLVVATDNVSVLISDPTENLLKESKGTTWGPINTGVQKGKRMDSMTQQHT